MRTIKFGKVEAQIVSSEWDSNKQSGIITFTDNYGNHHQTESLGMFLSEQHQAVIDYIMENFDYLS